MNVLFLYFSANPHSSYLPLRLSETSTLWELLHLSFAPVSTFFRPTLAEQVGFTLFMGTTVCVVSQEKSIQILLCQGSPALNAMKLKEQVERNASSVVH